MAKTYLSSAKYIIHMDFEVDGIVDKPDVIGAVFGQSEGLLGEEMDLKELQQSGKIGRIEIESHIVNGKTKGELTVPSSMDMAQTALLAATIETVDKVGPYQASFKTREIEDARSAKREEIKGRAQELIKKFVSENIPSTAELTDEIKESLRIAELQEYGKDKLPCGPGVFESDEIIVVEGRADVINLLKNGIKNVVGFGGANISPTIADLVRGKKVIAFIDGDRGGELILRKLQQMIKVDFVARAPTGKEVEELTRKEIVAALKKPEEVRKDGLLGKMKKFIGFGSGREEQKTVVKDLPIIENSKTVEKTKIYPTASRVTYQPSRRFGKPESRIRGSMHPRMRSVRKSLAPHQIRRRPTTGGTKMVRQPTRSLTTFGKSETILTDDEKAKFYPIMEKLKGTLKAKLFDSEMNEIKEVSVRELLDAITTTPHLSVVIFDGVITQRLVDAAELAGVDTIVGIRKGKIDSRSIRTITLS